MVAAKHVLRAVKTRNELGARPPVTRIDLANARFEAGFHSTIGLHELSSGHQVRPFSGAVIRDALRGHEQSAPDRLSFSDRRRDGEGPDPCSGRDHLFRRVCRRRARWNFVAQQQIGKEERRIQGPVEPRNEAPANRANRREGRNRIWNSATLERGPNVRAETERNGWS